MSRLVDHEVVLNLFFYEAKAAAKLVRVVDRWHRVHEGRLYRNGTDRVNVVSLDAKASVELYYFDIVEYEIIGDEPPGLAAFFTDWNNLRPRLPRRT